jgi:hypothetical protein
MIKTQHCPNCEATERKLHDFRQEVSDAVEDAFGLQGGHTLHRFIIPKPKPDPLVEVIAGWTGGTVLLASDLRAALEARGLEIRSKNDAQ